MKLEQIFSIKNEYIYNDFGIIVSKEKVISLFALKIKLKQKLPMLTRNLISNLCKLVSVTNPINVVDILMAVLSSDSELFCFKTESILCVFSKRFFELDKMFVEDFLNYNSKNAEFYILNKNSHIYQRHINKKSEFCWRYRYELNNISYQVIAKEKGEIVFKRGTFDSEQQMENKNSDESNSVIYKYVKGECVSKMLMYCSEEEQKRIFKKVIDYIFQNFTCADNEKMVYSADYQLSNFILDENNKFNLIDLGVDKNNNLGWEKEYCIYRVLKCSSITEERLEDLFKNFINMYNLENKFIHCKNFHNNRYDCISNETKEKYLKLFNKYFGLKAIISAALDEV